MALSFFPPEIENIFFVLLLPDTKPIILGIIYEPYSESNFLEIINSIQTTMRCHTFFKLIISFKATRFLVTLKNTLKFVQYLLLNN